MERGGARTTPSPLGLALTCLAACSPADPEARQLAGCAPGEPEEPFEVRCWTDPPQRWARVVVRDAAFGGELRGQTEADGTWRGLGLAAQTRYAWVVERSGSPPQRGVFQTGAWPAPPLSVGALPGLGRRWIALAGSCQGGLWFWLADAQGRTRWAAPLPDASAEVGEAEVGALALGPGSTAWALTGRRVLSQLAPGWPEAGASLWAPGGGPWVHHAVAPTPGGQVAALVVREEDGRLIDGVQLWDPSGDLLATWWVDQVLDLDLASAERSSSYWARLFPGAQDPTHANGLRVHPHGDALWWVVSLRHWNTVLAVDGDPASPSFGQELWRMAGPDAPEPAGLTLETFGPDPGFQGQHHPSFDQDGRLWLFDNGDGARSSRALAFVLDPPIARLTEVVDLPEACPIRGSVAVQGSDRLVLCGGLDDLFLAGPDQPLQRAAVRCDGWAPVGLAEAHFWPGW